MSYCPKGMRFTAYCHYHKYLCMLCIKPSETAAKKNNKIRVAHLIHQVILATNNTYASKTIVNAHPFLILTNQSSGQYTYDTNVSRGTLYFPRHKGTRIVETGKEKNKHLYSFSFYFLETFP